MHWEPIKLSTTPLLVNPWSKSLLFILDKLLSCRFHTTTTKLSVLSLLKTKLDGCVYHICAVLVNIDMRSFSAQMERVLVKHCLNIMTSIVKLGVTSATTCVDLKNTFLFFILYITLISMATNVSVFSTQLLEI